MPPIRCTICTHPARPAIDAALRQRQLSLRQVADRWSLAKTTVLRHRDRHLPPPTPLPPEVQESWELHRHLGAVTTALRRLTPAQWDAMAPGTDKHVVVVALYRFDTVLVQQWAAQWYQGWR